MINADAVQIIIPDFPVIQPDIRVLKDETAEQVRRYGGIPLNRLIEAFDGYCQIDLLAQAMILVRDRMIEKYRIAPQDFRDSSYNKEFEKDVAAELFVAKEQTRYNIVDSLGGDSAWKRSFRSMRALPTFIDINTLS